MYHNIGPQGPIRCSKCGSIDIVKPVNHHSVALRCLGCGHEKAAVPLTQTGIGSVWLNQPEPTDNTF